MGWRPHEVAACGLSEFNACWEGFASANGFGGAQQGMTAEQAQAEHREFFGND